MANPIKTEITIPESAIVTYLEYINEDREVAVTIADVAKCSDAIAFFANEAVSLLDAANSETDSFFDMVDELAEALGLEDED